jgi:hypothetical protein
MGDGEARAKSARKRSIENCKYTDLPIFDALVNSNAYRVRL